MHPHMLIGIVLHTTLLAIVGYALLFSASKAEGLVALIGRVLGIWVFILAILSVVAAIAMPMFGGGHTDQDHRYMMMLNHSGPPGMQPPPPGAFHPPPPPPGEQPPPPAPPKP
jgi:hypothetical protein